jgi:hypothetical protein
LERGREGTLSAAKRNQSVNNKGGKTFKKVGANFWKKEILG